MDEAPEGGVTRRTRPTWYGYFLGLADLTAGRSRDPRLQVGAVIVDSKSKVVIATGYNGFPRGVRSENVRHGPAEKHDWTVHAEENAIFNAARVGARTDGATLFTSDAPCGRCARAIVQAGIEKVVARDRIGRWLDPGGLSRHLRDAIFAEAGVSFITPLPIHLEEEI